MESSEEWIDIEKQLLSSDVKYIRYTFADIHGIPRGKIMTLPSNKSSLKKEIRMSLSSLIHGICGQASWLPEKIRDLGVPDTVFLPLPSTYHTLPWASTKGREFGQFLCEEHLMSNLSPTTIPRTLARRQLSKLNDLGFHILSAYEHEFMLLNHDSTPLNQREQGLSLSDMLGKAEIIFDMAEQLREAGVNIDGIHKEQGPSQFEMISEPQFGIKASDESFLIQDAITCVAKGNNILATFMTKPFDVDFCNGKHFNHSIWVNQVGENSKKQGAFNDDTDHLGLSEVARWWLGGLIAHAPAMTAICCPTVNCFGRFGGLGVPTLGDWGIDNRLTMIRVKMDKDNGAYFENRLPSGMANPYLVSAITIASGIDGIVNKIEPPAPGVGSGQALPKTLETALAALERDQAMVEALGEEFVELFCGLKRAYETNLPKHEDMEKQLLLERQTYLIR